jgi:hypothetical protein
MSENTVTLADLERLCWHLSGWSVDQRSVDELLAAVEAYAQGRASSAGALVALRGPGTPEGPSEPSAAPSATQETPGPVNGPQEGAQGATPRLHLTGTLTLVCEGHGQPAKPKQPKQRTAPVPPPAGGRPKVLATPGDRDARVCRTCADRQPLTEYARDPHGPKGRKTVCRTCENNRKRAGRQRRAAQQRAA